MKKTFENFKFNLSEKDKKESYSPDDLNILLEQQKNALGGFLAKDFSEKESKIVKLEKEKEELLEKNKKFLKDSQNILKEKIAKKVNLPNFQKILKHVKISEKDSEEDIEKKYESFSNDLFSSDDSNENTSFKESKIEKFESHLDKEEIPDEQKLSATDQWKMRMNNKNNNNNNNK